MSTTTLTTTPALPGPPRDLLFNTSFLLKRLGLAAKERSHQAFASTGVTGQHYAVLLVLEEGARETQGTIADALGYDRSLLVGLLDDLEQRGFLERKRDPADRRRHLVSLTDDGRRFVAELRALTLGLEQNLLEPLDADERRTLQALLLKLVAYHDIRCAATITVDPADATLSA